jgi:hypothetical protein
MGCLLLAVPLTTDSDPGRPTGLLRTADLFRPFLGPWSLARPTVVHADITRGYRSRSIAEPVFSHYPKFNIR